MVAEKLAGSTSWLACLPACLRIRKIGVCYCQACMYVRTGTVSSRVWSASISGKMHSQILRRHESSVSPLHGFSSMAECTELLLPNNRFLIPPAKRLPSQDRSSSLCFRTVSSGHVCFFLFLFRILSLLILPIFYPVVSPILARVAATSNSQSMPNVYHGNKRARASKSQMTNGAAKRGNSYVSSVLNFCQ